MRNSRTRSEGRDGELMLYRYPSVVSLSYVRCCYWIPGFERLLKFCLQWLLPKNVFHKSHIKSYQLEASHFSSPWTNHKPHMTRQREMLPPVSIPPAPTPELVSRFYGAEQNLPADGIWTWIKILEVAPKAFQGCFQGEDAVRTLSWLCLDGGCMEMKGL